MVCLEGEVAMFGISPERFVCVPTDRGLFEVRLFPDPTSGCSTLPWYVDAGSYLTEVDVEMGNLVADAAAFASTSSGFTRPATCGVGPGWDAVPCLRIKRFLRNARSESGRSMQGSSCAALSGLLLARRFLMFNADDVDAGGEFRNGLKWTLNGLLKPGLSGLNG